MASVVFWLALWATAGVSVVQSTFVTPNLPLSFFFSWDDPTAPFPVTVTEQCQTLHITWSRGSATGPNPSAPYFLHVYTSNFIQPFIIPAGSQLAFDWMVPFAPGTIYQICMFDIFGNTGGCQDRYTVIAPSTTPTCANVTFSPQLEVSALVNNGNLSQYGFIDQCTDISVTPTKGTPPFTLTVAPSLHPPYNITSQDMQPINWTVSLSWASPFFISLADSKGALWSNGPLHAGSGASSECLAGNVTVSRNVKVPVAVGASFATLFLGAFLAAAGLYVLSRRRSKSNEQVASPVLSRWAEANSEVEQTPTDQQVYPFVLSQVGYQGSRNEAMRTKIQIPQPSWLRNRGTVFERPPSYPQEYSPSDSDLLSRTAGSNTVPATLTTITSPGAVTSPGAITSPGTVTSPTTITSPGTSTSQLASTTLSFATPASRSTNSEKSSLFLAGEDRHYDPLGPLRMARSKRSPTTSSGFAE